MRKWYNSPVENRVSAWYFPGWMRCHTTDDEALRVASSTFGEGSVALRDWDGNVRWKKAVANADAEVSHVVAEIAGLSEDLRKQLVLIGHSLGGRIVARTLAQLADRGLKIRQGILLGAAIRDDDSDLLRMGNGSLEPVWVICNPDDNMLKYVYATVGGEGGAALGTNGSVRRLPNCREMAVPQDIVRQTDIAAAWGVNDAIKEIANHYAVFYLAYVSMLRMNGERQSERNLVLQDLPNMELKVANAGIWWKTLEVWEDWQLQRHVLTGHFRSSEQTGRNLDRIELRRRSRKKTKIPSATVVAAPIRSKLCVRRRRLRSEPPILTHTYTRRLKKRYLCPDVPRSLESVFRF